MIGWLSGTLRARRSDRLVVDVGGVGYLVQVPVGVAGQAALGEEVELHVHTHVREDQIALFGFDEEAQLRAFHVLIGVSGVGPKLAMNILGGISPGQLAAATDHGDIARLKALPGVGKRLAERLSVELKGKLEHDGSALSAAPAQRAKGPEGRVWSDLRSALQNLQYRPKEIDEVLGKLGKEMPEAAFDDLLKAALGLLRR